MAYDQAEVQSYIRDAAARRGIDPNTALRVIKQESGFNPAATNLSPKEKSYGLMQLNTQGGLGVHALEQGIDIRNPDTWRQQVDFGLDTVAKDGWRQWYGARDVGIGRWDGIGGRPTPAPAPPPLSATQRVGGGSGQDTAVGGTAADTLDVVPEGLKTNPGGLGVLGGFQGFVNSEGFGDTLTALGRSLLESPSNAPLSGFGKAMESIQDRRVKEAYYADQRADRQEARAERQASMQSTIQLLMSRGMSRDEATALAANPSAATAALTFREADADRARGNTTAEALRADHPDLADGIMSGAITGGEALKEAYARRREGNKAPTLQSIYTENGAEQRGYFNGSNEWVPVGGTKAPSGSGSGGSSLPSGYRWTDPSRPGVGMEPIPGGPGEQISGENAGRIGIAKSFLEDLPGIRNEIAAGNATGLWDATLGRSGIASQGRLYSRIDAGVDALQRMLSGAGTPDAETARYARRYMATPTDTAETLTEKMNQLERELNNQMSIVTRGRGNVMGEASPAPAASGGLVPGSDAGVSSAASVPRARNPQTGETVEFRNGQWVTVR